MTDSDSIEDYLGGKTRSRRRIALFAGATALGIVFIAGGVWFVFAPGPQTGGTLEPVSIFSDTYSGARGPGYDDFTGIEPRPMPLCGAAPFDNCVVDGDTFWLNGRKIRLVNADAPELVGRCADESVRAREAAKTLSELLDREPITIRAQGRDRFGRLLATIRTRDGDVGLNMIRFREAVAWGGHREPDTDWCAG